MASEIKPGLNAGAIGSSVEYVAITYICETYTPSTLGFSNSDLVNVVALSAHDYRYSSKAYHYGVYTSQDKDHNLIRVYLAFDPVTGDIYVNQVLNNANFNRAISDLRNSETYKTALAFNNRPKIVKVPEDWSFFYPYVLIGLGCAISFFVVIYGFRLVKRFL